jgi:hypothetical protein
MAFVDHLSFILQLASIAGSGLSIVFAVILLSVQVNFGVVLFYVLIVFFCVLMIIAEVRVFPIFRYCAFMLTIWGKGLMFLFLGFFEFRDRGVGLAAAVLLWIMFVVYVTLFFFVRIKTSLPLMQKTAPPEFETTQADYFPGPPTPDDPAVAVTAELNDGSAEAPPQVDDIGADSEAPAP